MVRKRRPTDDTFQIFRSLKAQYPISQFGVSTKCVLDIQEIESIESAYNREMKKNYDFKKFIVVNRIIRNRFEQGLTKTLNRHQDMVGLAGINAANLKHVSFHQPESDSEEGIDDIEDEDEEFDE